MLKEFFNSKKIKALILGVVGVLVGYILTFFGLDKAMADALTTKIVGLVATYIGAQGLADGLSKGKTSSGNGITPPIP